MKTLLVAIAVVALLALLAVAAGAAGRLDRSRPPVPGPAPAVRTPKIVKQTLKNGLSVWVVTRRELPVVNAALGIWAGSACDGTRPGIAAMTAALLDEGTAKRSALEFAEAVNFIGASLSATATTEYGLVTLQTLSKHLDAALGLMGEMVVQPAFQAEEVERERKSRLQGLRQEKDVASAVADKVFNLVVYGEEHPYGRPARGTPASVEAVTRDEIAGFYDRYYRPNNATLIVVGDVTVEQLIPRLEQAFAGWRAGPVPDDARAVPPRPAARPTTVYLVDKPNAAQSEIRIGHAGAARTAEPDYYALQVLNTALGGQFTSRVNLNLREKHGFTYGARSSWSFRRGDGPFAAGAGVFTAKTDSALAEFLRELTDIRGPRPIGSEEAEFARNAIVRGYPRRFETNDGVVTVLGELAQFGLPESEVGDFPNRIARVKPEEATRVANKYLTPESLAIVVVGDLAKVRAGIEALNLGPITVLDTDGKPVPAQ